MWLRKQSKIILLRNVMLTHPFRTAASILFLSEKPRIQAPQTILYFRGEHLTRGRRLEVTWYHQSLSCLIQDCILLKQAPSISTLHKRLLARDSLLTLNYSPDIGQIVVSRHYRPNSKLPSFRVYAKPSCRFGSSSDGTVALLAFNSYFNTRRITL